MEKIRRICLIAIACLVPVAGFYIYDSVMWALSESFLQPDLWLSDNWVDPAAQIAFGTRLVFCVLWILPTVLGVIGYGHALRLLLLMRRGVLFDGRIAAGLFWTGFGVSTSALAKILAASLSPMIKSWHNPDGPLPLRLWYRSEDYALVFCGLGFVVLGLVMREAIKLARENEEFV